MDNIWYIVWIAAHILVELICIKLLFECPPLPNKGQNIKKLQIVKLRIEWFFRALVSSFCGTLLFVSINRERAAQKAQENSMKNTLWPFMIHVILCLLEHLIVVGIPTSED